MFRTPRFVWWLAALLCASVALRLVFAVFRPPPAPPDAGHYDALARSMLDNGSFPSAYRSPGYPAFVAMIYRLVGERPTAVLVVQAVLSTAAVWLVYALGVDVLGRDRRAVALVAAALVGLNPEIAAYSGTWLREAVGVPLVLLGAWLCVRMLTRAWRYALLLGPSLAVLAYVRMEGCTLVMVMLAGAMLRRTWRRRTIGGGLLAACITLAAVSPWVLHCTFRRGYVGMQAALAPNLFARAWYLSPSGALEPALRRHIANRVAQAGLTEAQIRRCVIPPMLLKELPFGQTRAEAALYDRLGSIATENIRNRWLSYLADSARHLKTMMGGYSLTWWRSYWQAPPFPENVRRGQWGVVAVKVANRVIWPALMFSLTAVSLVSLWQRGEFGAWPMTLLLCGAAACIVLVCLVTMGSPRLRLPYDGIGYLAASHGVVVLVRHCISRARRGKQSEPATIREIECSLGRA